MLTLFLLINLFCTIQFNVTRFCSPSLLFSHQVDSDKEDQKFIVPGTSNHLNLETELFLGGIDTSSSNQLPMDLFSGILRRGYVGCIKNLAIDGETIDLPRYVLKGSRDDIGAFCREERPRCDSNPCEHEGICTEGWNRFICDCRMTGYTGKTCSDGRYMQVFGHQSAIKMCLVFQMLLLLLHKLFIYSRSLITHIKIETSINVVIDCVFGSIGLKQNFHSGCIV